METAIVVASVVGFILIVIAAINVVYNHNRSLRIHEIFSAEPDKLVYMQSFPGGPMVFCRKLEVRHNGKEKVVRLKRLGGSLLASTFRELRECQARLAKPSDPGYPSTEGDV